MLWCCEAFKGCYAMAGERGIAILVDRRIQGRPTFTLQFRAMRIGAPLPPSSPEPITLQSHTCIVFCPWCGTNLLQHYGADVDQLARGKYMPEPLPTA